MTATLDYHFEELPLLVNLTGAGMLTFGKAEITFGQDGAWRMSRLWFDTTERGHYVEVLERDWFETTLWFAVEKALDGVCKDAIQSNVDGAVTDGAFRDDDDRYDLAAFPGPHVEHYPSISY